MTQRVLPFVLCFAWLLVGSISCVGGPPPLQDCPSGQSRCVGSCVDLQTSTTHCGTCSNACRAGESCTTGQCQPTCQTNESICSNQCTDLSTHPLHCGKCGQVCPPGETCTNGACARLCPANTSACGDRCIDLQNNPLHCGTCDNKCQQGHTCNKGQCQLICGAGTHLCNDKCVDLQANSNHCGSCKNKCPATQACLTGKCQLTCPTNTQACNDLCVDTQQNTSHCGACGTTCKQGEACKDGKCQLACPSGQQPCNDQCINLQANKNHCGTCGSPCEAGKVCDKGKCMAECPSNLTECAGACVDTRTNQTHCGACGTTCTNSETCASGTCVPLCRANQTNCNNTCVDTQKDTKHCGACGINCPTGTTCCKGTCKNLQQDDANCGTCGTTCRSDQVCDKGTCACQPGLTACGNTCFDLTTNRKHCGTCNNTCPSGKLCLNSTCEDAWAIQQKDLNINGAETKFHFVRASANMVYFLGTSNHKLVSLSRITHGRKNLTLWGYHRTSRVYIEANTSGAQVTPQGLAVDSNDNVYVAGSFASARISFGTIHLDNPPISNSLDPQKRFHQRAFVAMLNSQGQWQWATLIGGKACTQAISLLLDPQEKIVITGSIDASCQQAATFGTTTITTSSFTAWIDNKGSWQKASPFGAKAAIDTKGNIYMATVTADAVKLGNQTLPAAAKRLVLAKQNPQGQWEWLLENKATTPTLTDITTDTKDDVILTGTFTKTALFGNTTLRTTGTLNPYVLYVAKADPKGSWKWAVAGDRDQYNDISALTTDAQGDIYITGSIFDINTSFGTLQFQRTRNLPGVFVAKLNGSGQFQWIKELGEIDKGHGTSIHTSKGDLFVALDCESIKNLRVGSSTYNARIAAFGIGLKTDGTTTRVFEELSINNEPVEGCSIAKAHDGSTYVTGIVTGDLDFNRKVPPTERGIFVGKLDATGQWEWVATLGKAATQTSAPLAGSCPQAAIDEQGNLLISGYTKGGSFGFFSLPNQWNWSPGTLFVTKITPNGSVLWLTTASSPYGGDTRSMAVDASGASYVTGKGDSSTTFGKSTLKLSKSGDFFGKIDAQGSWVWVKSNDNAQQIHIDAKGQLTLTKGRVIERLDATGKSLWTLNNHSGTTDCNPCRSVVDQQGNTYITGSFSQGVGFGSLSLTNLTGARDNRSLFIAKADDKGKWAWAKVMGGKVFDTIHGVAVDDSDHVYLTGSFFEAATFGQTTLSGPFAPHTFVAKISPTGQWQWAKAATQEYFDPYHQGSDLVIDQQGTVHVVGTFSGNTTFGPNKLTSPTVPNLFVWTIAP